MTNSLGSTLSERFLARSFPPGVRPSSSSSPARRRAMPAIYGDYGVGTATAAGRGQRRQQVRRLGRGGRRFGGYGGGGGRLGRAGRVSGGSGLRRSQIFRNRMALASGGGGGTGSGLGAAAAAPTGLVASDTRELKDSSARKCCQKRERIIFRKS